MQVASDGLKAITPDATSASEAEFGRAQSPKSQGKKEKLIPLTTVYPRAYVVYDRQTVSRWQLRAYILWARDLFPAASKGVAHAFCR